MNFIRLQNNPAVCNLSIIDNSQPKNSVLPGLACQWNSFRTSEHYAEKTCVPFPFKLNGIWSWWRVSFRFWKKWYYIWLKLKGNVSPRLYHLKWMGDLRHHATRDVADHGHHAITTMMEKYVKSASPSWCSMVVMPMTIMVLVMVLVMGITTMMEKPSFTCFH